MCPERPIVSNRVGITDVSGKAHARESHSCSLLRDAVRTFAGVCLEKDVFLFDGSFLL